MDDNHDSKIYSICELLTTPSSLIHSPLRNFICKYETMLLSDLSQVVTHSSSDRDRSSYCRPRNSGKAVQDVSVCKDREVCHPLALPLLQDQNLLHPFSYHRKTSPEPEVVLHYSNYPSSPSTGSVEAQVSPDLQILHLELSFQPVDILHRRLPHCNPFHTLSFPWDSLHDYPWARSPYHLPTSRHVRVRGDGDGELGRAEVPFDASVFSPWLPSAPVI